MTVKQAITELINLQPHIAQLPEKYRPFIDAHVDKAIAALREMCPATADHSQHESYDEACPLCLEDISTAGQTPIELHARAPSEQITNARFDELYSRAISLERELATERKTREEAERRAERFENAATCAAHVLNEAFNADVADYNAAFDAALDAAKERS